MDANEIGDALAGAFAPLAFLWLIITVWVQKFELKQNTETLKQQADELRNLVQHEEVKSRYHQQEVLIEMYNFLILRFESSYFGLRGCIISEKDKNRDLTFINCFPNEFVVLFDGKNWKSDSLQLSVRLQMKFMEETYLSSMALLRDLGAGMPLLNCFQADCQKIIDPEHKATSYRVKDDFNTNLEEIHLKYKL